MAIWLLSLLVSFLAFSLPANAQEAQSKDRRSIRAMNQSYAKAWLENDENGVLSLFENDAIIAPSGMSPIRGIKAIEQFWFPKDTSTTIIHKFNNEMLNIIIEDTLAQSSQKTFLSWSYEKGATKIAKDQRGFAMTIYRRQADGTWKIWRHLWTDVHSENR
jgi:uncharacterized protein (TIGR02246 family)